VKATGDGDQVIASLKRLQDRLGQMHDIHILSEELVGMTEKAAASRARRVSEVVLTTVNENGEGDDEIKRARARDPGPGLLGLARLLHDRGASKFSELHAEWLGPNGSEFFDQVNEFAARIAARVAAGNEIEHKYLLKRVPALALEAPAVEIDQGYLPGDKLIERIRRVSLPDGAERWVRTVKSGNGLSRVELEEDADPDLSRAMWALTKGRRVHKRRYTIRESDDLVWEIDEFLDRDLVLAEIELPSVETQFDLPDWLKEVLDREVTDEKEYSNARLARAKGKKPAVKSVSEEQPTVQA
jgi:CYTH domain-containing protein